MESKPIWRSWTIIFNVLVVVAEAVAGGEMDAVIPPKYQLQAVVVANLLLRLKTSSSVFLK